MRIDKLRQVMAEQGLEAMAVSQLENIRYVSGYRGEGLLIVTGDRQLIVTDFRYYEQVEREAPDCELVKMTAGLAKALPTAMADLGALRIGFESAQVSYDAYASWEEVTPEWEWVPTKGIVLELRSNKDEGELAAIRKAVALGDEAIVHLMGVIRPGMTEVQVAWELEVYMRTHGAESLSFPTIVGSGPNGALPHAITSERVIQPGEPIVIDMGCKVDGYCSDMTRTFCVGHPADPERFHHVWDTVLEAQRQATAAIKAGVVGKDAHAVAQQVIEQAGYGDNFGHGLGHGVGLQIHEKPSVGRLSEDVLQPGAVVTVEPGIYLPGWGGVRIEDMGVVRADGIEIFTAAPKVAVVD